MAKYRLKQTYDYWIVQKKFLFIWINCKRTRYHLPDNYVLYQYAKARLEKLVKLDEEWRIENQKRKSFVTRYFYPPLPDQEPQ